MIKCKITHRVEQFQICYLYTHILPGFSSGDLPLGQLSSESIISDFTLLITTTRQRLQISRADSRKHPWTGLVRQVADYPALDTGAGQIGLTLVSGGFAELFQQLLNACCVIRIGPLELL